MSGECVVKTKAKQKHVWAVQSGLHSNLNNILKPLFGRPGPPGLKCTSSAAPTLQQTVACGLWGFKFD